MKMKKKTLALGILTIMLLFCFIGCDVGNVRENGNTEENGNAGENGSTGENGNENIIGKIGTKFVTSTSTNRNIFRSLANQNEEISGMYLVAQRCLTPKSQQDCKRQEAACAAIPRVFGHQLAGLEVSAKPQLHRTLYAIMPKLDFELWIKKRFKEMR